MKQRVITGIGAALFGVLVMCFVFTPVVGVVIAIVAGIASFEIQHVAKVKNKILLFSNIAVAAAMPLILEYDLLDMLPFPKTIIVTAYVLIMLFIMLGSYKDTKFEDTIMSMFAGVVVPYALASVILLRDIILEHPELFNKSHAVYLILFGLFCAWCNDTFAYFVGRKFGKHKLAPNISPKKTIEGAIGGVVLTMIFNVIVFFVFDYFFFELHTLKVWMIIPASLFLSTISICGDLSASVIKRNFGEKDYGTIFPGHGGIMDRFDSYSFVMPVLYAIVLTILNWGV